MPAVAVIVLLLSVLTSTPVLAAWAVVQGDEYGTLHIDLGTRHATKEGVAVWTLYDSEIPSEVGVNQFAHSTRVKAEFNCEKGTARTLAMVRYTQRMANGQVVDVKQVHGVGASQITDKWEAIDPRTTRAKVLALVCSK